MTVGAFARSAIDVGGPWQAIVPAAAAAVLVLLPLGHAGIWRSGRRRSNIRYSTLVPVAAGCQRWCLARDRMLLARSRTMVFWWARPARRRLLVA
jgi:hypothetical protein